MTTNVDTDASLSLAAVGLWHRLKSMSTNGLVERSALLLVEQSPSAFGPERGVPLQDVASALDELMGIGYAQGSPDGPLALYFDQP
jgi:hypothetical protein